MSLVSFFRLKCIGCGKKFTMSSEHSCNRCKHLGIQCTHKKYCLRCLQDRIFIGMLIAISLTAYYALGLKIL